MNGQADKQRFIQLPNVINNVNDVMFKAKKVFNFHKSTLGLFDHKSWETCLKEAHINEMFLRKQI